MIINKKKTHYIKVYSHGFDLINTCLDIILYLFSQFIQFKKNIYLLKKKLLIGFKNIF